jgi:LPXTG-site transpeptidase (sortase) family protein
VDAHTYDLTASGGNLASFNGMVGIDLAAGQNITGLTGIALHAGEPAIDETYVLDNTPIVVVDGGVMGTPGDLIIVNAGVYTRHFTAIEITFSEDADNPAGSSGEDDVTNPRNYILLKPGLNGIYDTTSCLSFANNGNKPLPDDVVVPTGPVTYDDNANAGPFVATVVVNNGNPLPSGDYRLLICGTTSIIDLVGNPLGNGVDHGTTFNIYDPVLPATGFAPDRVTVLPEQGVEYASLGDLWLEIPKLGVQMDIVGVPQANGKWDVSWLGRNAGWLQGTAFPTWSGNSVLTAHVWNADNSAGPFVYLNTLWYGDRIIVHAWGQEYTYEVRSVKQVRPDSATAAFQHRDNPWLTLLTCRSWDADTGTYRYRVLVQAVLIDVK